MYSQQRKFGYYIGKGFQIQDDVLEIFSDVKAMGKSLGREVNANKQTALTLMARKLVPQDWNKFCERQGSQTIDEKLTGLRSFFENKGVYAETTAMADKYFKDAVNALAVVPNPGREDLLAYTNFIKNREY